MKISGKTKVIGIFGYPVEHTLSPAMHNAAFDVLALDCCYVPFLVHPDYLADAVRAIKAMNIRGVNITVPHKEKVIALLDEVDEEASFIGAVNTVVNTEGKLKGYNTDGRGFMQSVLEHDITLEGKDILIVGAGGASRAIGYHLCQKAGSLSLYGRTKEKAKKLVNDLSRVRNNVSLSEEISDMGKFHIIVNATPLGLNEADPLPFNINQLNKDQVVCDLIYKKTHLLKEAAKKGCITLDGLGMLLWQGVFAFEIWTGIRPPVEIMRSALMNA